LPQTTTFNTKLFADDAVLTTSHASHKILNEKVNSELIKIDQWMKQTNYPSIIQN